MTTITSPTVSVVIIFWNEAAHLGEAIESVLSQAPGNWELVLVDDGSTDGSAAIASAYRERHPDLITLVCHPDRANRGMSASRNLGVRHSRGEWITFLDGDDVWEAEKIQSQLPMLRDNKDLEVLVSPALWWYNSTAGPADFIQSLRVAPDSVVEGSFLVEQFIGDEWASLCDVMVRREVFEAVGGYEPGFRDMFEDQVFHTKLLLGRRVFVAGRWWYRYRQHPHTSTAYAHANRLHRRARIRFLTWALCYTLAQRRIRVGSKVAFELLHLWFRVGTARRLLGSVIRRTGPGG